MHRTRLRLLSELVVSVSRPKALRYRATSAAQLLYAPQLRSCNSFHTGSARHVSAAKELQPSDGVLKKLFKGIGFLDVSKSKLQLSGYLLYECVADRLNYANFFTEFNMPDTFYSWFVVTELHVWMLMVRTMTEGDEGRYSRNCIVEALWADVSKRSKSLGGANPSGTRMQVQELSQQFNAAIIGYDEGLMGDDKVLAGALWRRFFQLECNNPEHLERLVIYIRKQILMLDKLPKEKVLIKPDIEWLDLKH